MEPDTTAPIITLTDSQTTYGVGDTVNLGCTALDSVDGVRTCTYTGSVNNMVEGDYDITYSSTDLSSNTATQIVTYTITQAGSPLTWDLETYYDDAEGKYGLTLEAALTIIVNNGFSGVSYDDARYVLDDTDEDPAIPGNVILVYLQESRDGVWDCSGTCIWNREHVFPQSLLGVSAGGTNVASDLHNLKPADPSENSSRSNDYFTWDSLGLTGTYEPPIEVKGDIARILFYMQVMYNDESGYDLELVDGLPAIYEMGDLATLLEWHELDPVDDFERDRNDAIFAAQGNYNPFIDYPHFVELIWGTHSYYTN